MDFPKSFGNRNNCPGFIQFKWFHFPELLSNILFHFPGLFNLFSRRFICITWILLKKMFDNYFDVTDVDGKLINCYILFIYYIVYQ